MMMLLRRGDIAIERLTGRRTMVIHVTSPDEVTCRFDDGRLEDRFLFELDPPPPTWVAGIFDGLVSFLRSPSMSFPSFGGESGKKRQGAQPTASRPRATRPPAGQAQ